MDIVVPDTRIVQKNLKVYQTKAFGWCLGAIKVYTTRINIQTFLVVLTNWMKVLIFIHRKRLGLYQNDFCIDVLKFSTYVPRFFKTFT